MEQPAYPQDFDSIRVRPPKTDAELYYYVWLFFGLKIPFTRICEEHNTPYEYLSNSYFGRHKSCVCWANRGGGKTQLGAVTTQLDSIHKPGCHTRILGGSLEQSNQMYVHCDRGWDHFRDYIKGDVTQKRTKLCNGSGIEILAASAKSVRGPHVQRLKMDEIDEIESKIYDAAIPMAMTLDGIGATTECFSTMHHMGGQMAKAIDMPEAKVYKWCIWETIEKCRDRNCSQCPLYSDCQGKAKRADGYIAIDDVISWMRLISRASWEAEVLCERPAPQGVVFYEFGPDHVRELSFNPNLPVYRAIDFGYNFFCCLYIQEHEGNVRVIDEYKGEQKSLPLNVEGMRDIEKPFKNSIIGGFADPAGTQRNDQTGKRSIEVLKEYGINCTYTTVSKWRNVVNGINLIRDYLAPASGKKRLFVSSKCKWLINSFYSYTWKERNGTYIDEPEDNTPWEHPMDSLRYYMVNQHGSGGVGFYR